jgi:opacity protein-like surface antigen
MKRRSPRPRVACLAALLIAALASAADAEVEPAFNAEIGGPQKLSANLGIRIPAGSEAARGYGRGVVFQVQPGIAGGSVNLGWMPLSFAAQGTQALGVGVKARLLRTWGSPWGADADRTYAGVEAAAVIGVKASVGVMWKLGSDTGRKTIVTWGVGIGF